MKCIRLPSNTDGKCVRCTRSNSECIVPQRQLGRKKGSTNRFTELNRTLRQASQGNLSKEELNRALREASQGNNLGTDALVDALRLATQAKAGAGQPTISYPSPAQPSASSSSSDSPHLLALPPSPTSLPGSEFSRGLAALLQLPSGPSPPQLQASSSSEEQNTSGSSVVLSNPLGLLSDVCADADSGPIPASRRRARDDTDVYSLTLQDLGVAPKDVGRHADGFDWFTDPATGPGPVAFLDYFKPVPLAKLEIDDPDFDPIVWGIVSEKEVQELLDFFHTYLRPITLALDPYIATMALLRRTSPFLLTAVCACASNFLPTSNSGLTVRLYNHFDKLTDLIKTRGYRSISIVHALTLGSGWTRPASHVAKERSWGHYTHAASLAVELSLHSTFMKYPLSSSSSGVPWAQELALLGPDPTGEGARRLQRHAERGWLHLYLWGSGLARTHGRPWVTGAEDFGPSVDTWYQDPFALPEDRLTVALVNLRALGSTRLLPLVMASDSNMPYELLRNGISRELDTWESKWLDVGDTSALYRPYGILLRKHIQVLAVSLALKHRPSGGRQILRDCFTSSLDVVHHVVEELENSASLRYMVNNIASMCLYSGVCAFKCLVLLKPSDSSVPMYLMSLLGKLSKLLVHFGTTPPHRQGISALSLCGEHLRIFLVRNGHTLLPSSLLPTNPSSVVHSPKAGVFEQEQDWLPFTEHYGWFDLGLGLGGTLDGFEEQERQLGMPAEDDFGDMFWSRTPRAPVSVE